jgi:prevent-host-death family protein
MERSVGVEEARNRLGRLAEEVNDSSDVVVLTRRGEPLAVLMGTQEYQRSLEVQRQAARAELQSRVEALRRAVSEAGIDVALVDEAVSAARRAG